MWICKEKKKGVSLYFVAFFYWLSDNKPAQELLECWVLKHSSRSDFHFTHKVKVGTERKKRKKNVQNPSHKRQDPLHSSHFPSNLQWGFSFRQWNWCELCDAPKPKPKPKGLLQKHWRLLHWCRIDGVREQQESSCDAKEVHKLWYPEERHGSLWQTRCFVLWMSFWPGQFLQQGLSDYYQMC